MGLLERILALIFILTSMIGILLSIHTSTSSTESMSLPTLLQPSTPQCPPCPSSFMTPCQEENQYYITYVCGSQTSYHCQNITLTLPCTDTLQNYTFTLNDTSITIFVPIPASLLEAYKRLPRLPTRDYSYYATDPADTSIMRTIIRQAESYAQILHVPITDILIRFVQTLPYTPDALAGSDEYPQYPLETLARGSGDCEDTAILLARLLSLTGEDVMLLRLPDHMAVAVPCPPGKRAAYTYENKTYCYVETTDPWPVGIIPTAYVDQPAEFLTVKPKPYLTLSWNATREHGLMSTITITATLTNKGTAPARNITLYAMLDTTQETRVYNQTRREIPFLDRGMNSTQRIRLSLPGGVRTRVHLILTATDHPPREAISTWFTS